jgi:hypothetical protein
MHRGLLANVASFSCRLQNGILGYGWVRWVRATTSSDVQFCPLLRCRRRVGPTESIYKEGRNGSNSNEFSRYYWFKLEMKVTLQI